MIDVSDYLIRDAGVNWQSALGEWSWLLPTDFRVWMLTRAGDLFFIAADETVHMLDVGSGELRRVAVGRDDFYTRLDDSQLANDWFMIPLVDELVASGVVLGPEQCYSFRTLPILGGSYAAENRVALSIREHLEGWGAVHRQLSDVPDGSEVVIKASGLHSRRDPFTQRAAGTG